MTVINTNGAALRALGASRLAETSLDTAMNRLSTGKRINSAKDDAAGLAIASTMTAQIMGMRQGMRNAIDGTSLVQTADGALGEVTNMAQRIRELAVQAASGTYSDSDRAALQVEVSALTKQIETTLNNTQFNGVKLFDTVLHYSYSDGIMPEMGTTVSIQAGANANDRIDVRIDNIPLSYHHFEYYLRPPASTYSASAHLISFDDYVSGAKRGGTPVTKDQIGTTVQQQPGDQWADLSSGRGWYSGNDFTLSDELNVTNRYRAENTMKRMDEMLTKVSSMRAGIGATANRLESVVNNLTTNTTNLSDARSRIEDADFSVETVNLARAQILKQASASMLAQANQSQQDVMKLLGN
ncbi:flagellin [uncultured Sphingomonas sp.]|uniref:flagellin N-terminal helical domain-containing protein n=1 Tax=uncultured Sphingomonas sp. TaxID=158754 RepID=UPI00262FB1B7|nr:flagellin [uncultured Sphingomonas sp.]